LIAAGSSNYSPLVENTSKENMAKNRRTRIVIIPNLYKFFALPESEQTAQVESFTVKMRKFIFFKGGKLKSFLPFFLSIPQRLILSGF